MWFLIVYMASVFAEHAALLATECVTSIYALEFNYHYVPSISL